MDQKIICLFLCCISTGMTGVAQVEVKGKIMDQRSGVYLDKVKVCFEGEKSCVFTDKQGTFLLEHTSDKPVVLSCALNGYERIRMPLEFNLNEKELDLGSIGMTMEVAIDQKNDWVELGPDDIEVGQYGTENYAGVLGAGMDLFSRAAAFDFGPNFFRPRFLGAEDGTIMLNGVTLNKVYNGRPEWSNWGGLNDALRNQERYPDMVSSQYNLGGLSKSLNMVTNASSQREGLKFSMALSNKTYQSRIMATYFSGLRPKGWAFTVAGSLRYAMEGYREGSNYRAISFLASIDKQFGSRHLLNATLIYASNIRGKSSPMTQEVYDLKNATYNAYWGYQEGKKRNAREKKVLEPIIQINHNFQLNKQTSMYSHFTYQFGTSTASRLEYGGGSLLNNSGVIVGGGTNPDPTYYQKLPSYFLRDIYNPDYGRAYLAEKNFQEQAQINWGNLYAANQWGGGNGNAIYVLYDDRRDSSSWSLNSGLSTRIGNRFTADASVSFAANGSDHYAYMLDLLGGSGHLDVDTYTQHITKAQNNLRDPNRIVVEEEKFKYNYRLKASIGKLFIRTDYLHKKSAATVGFEVTSTDFSREGLFENGFFPGNRSFGASKKAQFLTMGLKGGFSHKFNGRNIVMANANFIERAPALNNVFSNVRVSNELVNNLRPSSSLGMDMKYVWRHSITKIIVAGYYIMLRDESKISFYYADGISGLENANSSAYVQEVLTGIGKQNMGFEISAELSLMSNFKFKGIAAVGNSVYAVDPELYLSSNTFEKPLYMGTAVLRGYNANSGPQQAYSIGFEYSSPNFWWISSSLNYFDKSYVSIAPITRTKNFFLDTDGLPIQDLDMTLAKELLIQEQFKPYMNLNVVGGKSWKIKNWYLGLFVSINNLLDSHYKTGGFEQSRNANYLTLLEDSLRERPLFGPKYWFSYGTTFFTSFYVRI